MASQQGVRSDRAAAHRKHWKWRKWKRQQDTAGGVGWVQYTEKTSILCNRFRFTFYKLHYGSSGEDGLVALKLGQDRPHL